MRRSPPEEPRASRPPVGSNPYGIEGYKTIAYEVAEELDWTAPDVMVVPSAYSDGLFGIWKGYAAILAGERAAIAVMKPGTPARGIFQVAVQTTREAGIPHYQRHHVGHGIGLEPYDPPTLNEVTETPLEPGMVFCVETPYYEHGWGGLQVEDAVEVTATGTRRLTRSSQDLAIIG